MEVLRIIEDEVSDDEKEEDDQKYMARDKVRDETRDLARDEKRDKARDERRDMARDERRDMTRDERRDITRDMQGVGTMEEQGVMQKKMSRDKAIGIGTPEPVLTVEKVLEVFNRIKNVTTPAINSKLAVPFKKNPVKDSTKFKQDYSEVKSSMRKISGGLGKDAYQEEKKSKNYLPFPWPASSPEDTEGTS